MGYRNLFLLNPARLSVRNEQLIIETDERCSVPLEDIETIILDNLQVSITGVVLEKCCAYGITLHVSGQNHLPGGVLISQNRHSRRLQVLENQLALSKPDKKQFWQQIIIRKISNQAAVLKQCGCARFGEVEALSQRVKSGDTENVEAVAAALYFKLLFEPTFKRKSENILNAFLNYGYAIFRSTLAKHICVYGFEPSIGIFHHNKLNNFNLADDLIEPFRPLVDLHVVKNASDDLAEFNSYDKAALVNLLNMDVLVDGKRYAASYAMEKLVQSLAGAVAGKEEGLLLPTILPLKQHEYE